MFVNNSRSHFAVEYVMTQRSSSVPERDTWVHRLQIAIVKQAADDLRTAIRTRDENGEDAVEALCRWFLSEWGQLLSFGQGEAIIRRIKKEEEEREQQADT